MAGNAISDCYRMVTILKNLLYLAQKYAIMGKRMPFL
jgi:hypothetical protein